MFEYGKTVLYHKNLADAPEDYAWQKDPELAYLTATTTLATSFADYVLQYANQLRMDQPAKHQFAIKTRDDRHIGNCACYSINSEKREAEIGIIIGDRRYWNKGYGADAVTCLVDFIFQQSNIRRIHLKTLESNKRAQKCFQKCGFSVCGSMKNNGNSFILMELHRGQWLQNRISRKHQLRSHADKV